MLLCGQYLCILLIKGHGSHSIHHWETYEMVNHNGITFIVGQVSHHPPMSAAHAENEHFTYDVTSKLKMKFLGNSVEVYPVGRTRLTLKRSGVILDLVPPPTKVNSLIFGRTWIDSPGEMIMTNLTTGTKLFYIFNHVAGLVLEDMRWMGVYTTQRKNLKY